MLPISLRVFDVHDGTVLLPNLGHLTALTKLQLHESTLGPWAGQLPPLPALQDFVMQFAAYMNGRTWYDDDFWTWPGPQDLGLASSAPLLTSKQHS